MRCADLGPMPGKPAELVDQGLHRRRVGRLTLRSRRRADRRGRPGRGRRSTSPPSRPRLRALRPGPRRRRRPRRATRSSSISTSSGSTTPGAMVTDCDLAGAGHHDLHHAAAGRALDDLPRPSALLGRPCSLLAASAVACRAALLADGGNAVSSVLARFSSTTRPGGGLGELIEPSSRLGRTGRRCSSARSTCSSMASSSSVAAVAGCGSRRAPRSAHRPRVRGTGRPKCAAKAASTSARCPRTVAGAFVGAAPSRRARSDGHERPAARAPGSCPWMGQRESPQAIVSASSVGTRPAPPTPAPAARGPRRSDGAPRLAPRRGASRVRCSRARAFGGRRGEPARTAARPAAGATVARSSALAGASRARRGQSAVPAGEHSGGERPPARRRGSRLGAHARAARRAP